MRSPREIIFRLGQECANQSHLVFRRGEVPSEETPLARLPDPVEVAAALRGTVYARKLERIGRLLLRHRFPILGYSIDTGPDIDWRRDYVHGKTTGKWYFRLLPYLDFDTVGDHKIVWELNRHQHWIVLAQCWLLTGEEEFLDEIWRQFRSWSDANPYLRSINWASALEVAFRALSWTWVYHLAGNRMPEDLRREFLLGLYRHGLHLESNLSVYFAPNTHLLGEALALHALGALFPQFPHAARWRRTGGKLMREEAVRQVRDDGSHFEQSTYYHVYALDMFLFHACVEGLTPDLHATISSMAGYLAAVTGPARRLPLIGDDDGGRLFHPYGPRERFGRATLVTASVLLGEPHGSEPEDAAAQTAWWIGPRALRSSSARPTQTGSRLFRDSGLAAMSCGDLQVLADLGPFGPFSAGHSHSDTLSILVRDGAEDVLVDPGTCTYVSDPGGRDWFRGSSAHNTVRTDEKDQAEPAAAFRWIGRPEVRIEQWVTGGDYDFAAAVSQCRGIRHRRQILFLKGAGMPLIVIADTVECEGEHRIEQFWHPGAPVRPLAPACFRIGSRARLTLAGPAQAQLTRDAWRSCVFGHKAASPVVRFWANARGPVRLVAVLDFSSDDSAATLSLTETGSGLDLEFAAGMTAQVCLPFVGQDVILRPILNRPGRVPV